MIFKSANPFQTKSGARRAAQNKKAELDGSRVRLIETADGWLYAVYK